MPTAERRAQRPLRPEQVRDAFHPPGGLCQRRLRSVTLVSDANLLRHPVSPAFLSPSDCRAQAAHEYRRGHRRTWRRLPHPACSVGALRPHVGVEHILQIGICRRGLEGLVKRFGNKVRRQPHPRLRSPARDRNRTRAIVRLLGSQPCRQPYEAIRAVDDPANAAADSMAPRSGLDQNHRHGGSEESWREA